MKLKPSTLYGFHKFHQTALLVWRLCIVSTNICIKPADRATWKVVPTHTPNPLPEALKEAALKLEAPSVIPLPVAIVLFILIGGLTWLIRRLMKRRAKNQQ
jgi:hypothetical protein